MENNFGENTSITLPEVRLVLIGGRWAGKSSSGNTILGEERFECGRIRTAQSEKRRAVVGGRRLIVVDTPGWRSSRSLSEIPEVDKQELKLNASTCMPGPNVFLLVVPIDTAFSADSRRTVEEHMKLLGERVWRYTMVLFTCGDFLGEKNIEQHIESEGDSLKWLMERCSNRYHVFNNHEQSPSNQVTRLLEEIDEMLWHNNCSYYKVDEQTLDIMKKKQQEVAERAGERRRRSEEQRHQMKALTAGKMITIPKLHMVLLGSRSAGKTSLGNTLLGNKEQEVGKWTARSVARQGFLGQTEITLVDTPGWWKGFPVCDTPEAIKDELMTSPFQCRPGPHVFLLVIDADASFNAKHLLAVTTHMDLLGEGVWRHTIVVFTRGDWLGTHTIEQYIEGEGQALQSLVEQCGNRYHVIDNKNADDGTQTTELLGRITETVAGNNWDYFVPDEKIYLAVEKRKKSVKKGALLRQSQVHAKRKTLRDSSKELQELTVVMLGQKTSGKSATGNNLLCKEVFATCQNESCQVGTGDVAGRLVTVIDTPGWRKDPSRCTQEMDIELVRGLSLSPLGVHAVLLVVPLDLAFGELQQAALEDHMDLFDASIWKHTMVVFTHGDKLAHKSIEEHIEREHSALRWLIDKCENKYHVMNNRKKANMSQGTELFEKIDEMMAGNGEQLFCPEMNDIYLRIEEKFRRRQLKHVLKQRLKEEYQKRELKLMEGFKETLLQLQADVRGNVTSTKSMSQTKGIGLRKKEGTKKKENIDSKISQEIEKLEKDIRTKSSEVLQSSKDFLVPSLNGESPAPSIAYSLPDRKSSTGQFDKVLRWLSTLQIGTNVDNQMTLKFSQTSGYGSVLPHDNLDFDTELMNES
ncbi:GTPase IMAP family member 8 isoform X2 [Etheostoma spectabile]|uniref:GTPase IMAP family member 8 isoform X2 n=1 Tax=Etheostoma spectabile TaxID=54343 RepID=UPI0013AF2B6E|nr:GTPase IMAP family member 8-like isoform X2 [Etheostoma spectabile]